MTPEAKKKPEQSELCKERPCKRLVATMSAASGGYSEVDAGAAVGKGEAKPTPEPGDTASGKNGNVMRAFTSEQRRRSVTFCREGQHP